jgi:hypothetical protein
VRFHVLHQVVSIPCRGTRCGISAIPKEVDVDLRNTDFMGCLEKSVEMGYMGVNTTVRDL